MSDYIEYKLINSFLSKNQFSSPENSFRQAFFYFKENGLVKNTIDTFPLDLDILLTSDADFEKMCDNIPVSLSEQSSDSILNSSSIIPINYDCFIIRHINSLSVNIHSHDYFEIAYLWKGHCIQSFGDENVKMEQGDFIIIPPGTKHKIIDVTSNSLLFNIVIRNSLFQSSAFIFLTHNNALSAFFHHCLIEKESRKYLPIHTDNSMILKRIIKHFCQECYNQQNIFCHFVNSVLDQCFCYIILNGEIKSDTCLSPSEYISFSILKDIQQNYDTLTLQSLADKYYFSKEYLSRLIKKTTGKTFSQLIRAMRIEQAKLLIERMDINLENISHYVGYKDYTNFSKYFHKETGVTPMEYKHQILKDLSGIN